MPFAVLLEIPLQVCGWLAAYVGSALTSDEDLSLPQPRRHGRPARRRRRPDRHAHVAGDDDQGLALGRDDHPALRPRDVAPATTPVYRGDTYFGFFRREALADQVGIREAVALPADGRGARPRPGRSITRRAPRSPTTRCG